MTVILRDIDVAKRKQNNIFNTENQLWDLDEYRKQAERCIGRFGPPQLSTQMLKDEDAVSHVAEHMMYAHCKWTEGGGMTLKSYLIDSAIYAIRIWKTKLFKANQRTPVLSLNHTISNGTGRSSDMYTVITDTKAHEPVSVMSDEECSTHVEELLNSPLLTDVQRECMHERFVEGNTLQVIADKIGMSKQGVDHHIKRATAKLKDEYGRL